MFSWRVINWCVFETAKTFQVHNLVDDLWEMYHEVDVSFFFLYTFPNKGYRKILHRNLQIFQTLNYVSIDWWFFVDMGKYILAEDRTFKTFLKEI